MGAGFTDLDFIIEDEAGEQIHSDNRQGDRTRMTINKGAGEEVYTLYVENLGGRPSSFSVTVTDLEAPYSSYSYAQ